MGTPAGPTLNTTGTTACPAAPALIVIVAPYEPCVSTEGSAEAVSVTLLTPVVGDTVSHPAGRPEGYVTAALKTSWPDPLLPTRSTVVCTGPNDDPVNVNAVWSTTSLGT